jgi:ribosomal protein S18 acetylase RimI-like enzyme
MFHLLQYGVLLLVLFFLTATAYIRIKMKFWHLQPVFHLYDLRYWVQPPGIIKPELPVGNKFLNIVNIQTVAITDEDDTDPDKAVALNVVRACALIQQHFVSDQRVRYQPTKADLLAYLQHSNHSGYLSFYKKPKMLFETSKLFVPADVAEASALPTSEAALDHYSLVAVSSARPLNVLGTSRSGANFVTYYIDNLCVEPAYRQQGLAPQMIQTQCHQLRHLNKKIQTCLFKREGALTAIVPLVAFHTAAFWMASLHFPPLHASMTCIDVNVKQLGLFADFVKAERGRFTWSIMPDLSNIAGLLMAGCLSIHLLTQVGQSLALYVFRHPKLYYKMGPTSMKGLTTSQQQQAPEQQAIELITVVKGTAISTELFVAGLGLALKQARTRAAAGGTGGAVSEVLLLEQVADAVQLGEAIKTSSAPLFTSPTAFYWYNYAAYTCEPSKFLILY